MINSEKIKTIIIEEIKGFDISNLDDNKNFQDAGIDSLDQINILFSIQEKYNIDIPDEAVEKCSSINGIISFVNDNNN